MGDISPSKYVPVCSAYDAQVYLKLFTVWSGATDQKMACHVLLGNYFRSLKFHTKTMDSLAFCALQQCYEDKHLRQIK